jgi:hypothetical protein
MSVFHTFSPADDHLFTMPDWVVQWPSGLPGDLRDFPYAPPAIVDFPVDVKLREHYWPMPDGIPITVSEATAASRPIITDACRGLLAGMARQWMTVAMARIASVNPSLLLNVAYDLFRVLVVMLEQTLSSGPWHCVLSPVFPFSLDGPVWGERARTNSLCLSLERDAVAALRAISADAQWTAAVAQRVFELSNQRRVHLGQVPSRDHIFLPHLPCPIKLPPMSLVVFNEFGVRVALAMAGLVPMLVPLFSGNCTITINAVLAAVNELENVSLFEIGRVGWPIFTAFELMLVIKNAAFLAKSEKVSPLIKATFLNIGLCNSPFLFPFLPRLCEFVHCHFPPHPRHFSTPLTQRLLVLSSRIARDKVEPCLAQFYAAEHAASELSDSMAIGHFPEFFAEPIPRPAAASVRPFIPLIDPGCLDDPPSSIVRRIGRLFDRYDNLVGFPFWDVYPLWLRLNKFLGPLEDPPIGRVQIFDQDVIKLTNMSSGTIPFRFVFPRGADVPRVMFGANLRLADLRALPADLVAGVLDLAPGEVFMIMVDNIRGGWTSVDIDWMVRRRLPPPADVPVPATRDRFLADVREFVRWTPDDTQALLGAIPKAALREPTFASFSAFAAASPVASRFSKTVFALRAILLHQFNFVRAKHRRVVPDFVWARFTGLISPAEMIDVLTDQIVCTHASSNSDLPDVRIDRLGAATNPNMSVISQVAAAVHTAGADKFRCREKPWHVVFAGEQAIDAGGPARELLAEAAASFFAPGSGCAIQIGQYCLPVPGRDRELWAFGVILGIVIRTGIVQDLPFAPLVWKFVAGEKVGAEDVFELDPELKTFLDAVAQGDLQTTWAAASWDGHAVPLPGMPPGRAVLPDEARAFADAVVEFRIASIRPALKAIRKGFRENVGFKKDPFVTGKILSLAAEGTPVISIEFLKTITVVSGFEDGPQSPFIQRFWRVVSGFGEDDRRNLLRFMTTLTRIPNTAMCPDFRLGIDPFPTTEPDLMLPMASTCFNALHLPRYTNDQAASNKILYAIRSATTMENE